VQGYGRPLRLARPPIGPPPHDRATTDRSVAAELGLALVQKGADAFASVGGLAGGGHDLDGVEVGVALGQVDLGVEGLLAESLGGGAAPAGPAEQVTEVAQTPTPTAVPAVPTATPAPSVEGEPTPAPSATPGSGGVTADLAEWPDGRTAWTVVLNSSGTREDAERLGAELAGKQVPGVGVLDSNDFESLGPDSFVVFSGQYPDREQAEAALTTIRDRAGGGSTRRIVPERKAG